MRQFLVGGGVSVVNIAIHALVMTIVVRVAQTVPTNDTIGIITAIKNREGCDF